MQVSTSAKEDQAMTTATKPGDQIVVEAHRVGQTHRIGEILDVLGEAEHEHYRVRWEDGAETIVYPSNDARIEHRARSAKRRGS
jgi:hypothetical protein